MRVIAHAKFCYIIHAKTGLAAFRAAEGPFVVLLGRQMFDIAASNASEGPFVGILGRHMLDIAAFRASEGAFAGRLGRHMLDIALFIRQILIVCRSIYDSTKINISLAAGSCDPVKFVLPMFDPS